MNNYKIYVPSFFENHRAFPWDVLGYTIPKYAGVHSYVCSMIGPLANSIERPLLDHRPSMRELGRLAKAIMAAEAKPKDYENPLVVNDIHKYCEALYERPNSERKDVAQEVLDCLRRFEFYQEWVRDRLDYLWRQNLISIPRQHLTLVPEKKDQHGFNGMY